jgi:hypothetical protein
MFVSRFFAFGVTILASVSLVAAVPTAEKELVARGDTPTTVLAILTRMEADCKAPIDQIGSYPALLPQLA